MELASPQPPMIIDLINIQEKFLAIMITILAQFSKFTEKNRTIKTMF